MGRITGQPVVVFSYPIFDENENLEGVIFAAMDLQWFNRFEFNVESQLPEDSTLAKIDSKGIVLTYYYDHEKLIGKPLQLKSLLETIKTRGKGVVQLTDVDGRQRIFAFRPLASKLSATNTNNEMYVIVGIPIEVAFAETNRIMTLNLTLIGLMALFVVVVIWRSGDRLIIRPVNALVEVTRRLSEGDFSLRSGIPYTRGELGELARSFDGMAEALQMKQAEISKLSYAIEQSPVSIVITDVKGNIEYVNPMFVKTTGYTFEEVMGKNPRILKSGTTRPEEYRRLWKTIASGEAWRGIFHNVKKNGELFYESAVISPVTNRERVITHFIGIKEDITEQRKLQEQLRHAQKMEGIGTLAGGIAHDFNNMLNVIIGFGELMRMKMKEGDPNIPYLKEILAAGERATHLTRALLTLSRKQIISTKPVDINEIINEFKKMLIRIIGEDIEFRSLLTDKYLTVMADAGQIEQVLMNFATNAKDAMPEGGILSMETSLIELDNDFVRAHGYGAPGTYCLIVVTDTGSGMDEKTRERIFEPYFTTKEMGRGTGLGLSIVYGIIKQHNGYINCYSELGKGTTFRIYLPLITHEVVEEIESKVMMPSMGGSETILLAEDDASVRKLMIETLGGSGYQIIEAVDGEDAINKYVENKDPIQLLVLDVIMPKKSGKEAYDEIKKMKSDIKTLFVSGYTDDMIHRKKILGEDIVLVSKPILPNELLRKVREVLDGTK